MTTFEFWSLALGLITIILFGATVRVYWRILKEMQSQALLMQEQVTAIANGSTAQNTISLIHFIQEERYRQARGVVINQLEKKAQPWSQDEKVVASLVCSSYDILAILVRKGLVPQDIIVDEWGPSILRTHNILAPFMNEMRRNMGERYWDDFPWLADQAQKAGHVIKRPLPSALAEEQLPEAGLGGKTTAG